ncbi:hypothetical protein LVQ77_17060 [Buttiauxella sp. S04-F03]|uniref:hypothetical protein n=1 Tax=Buttiauxella sp. W03-F01 TaxID=2904524 RepID=UPI001E483BD3|nr:hypothetical protein [Buttiauxella sp. W03-F01]MCE0801996.1 hypothetical protein [Buttiauxella sp. W03-F01]
MITDYIAHETLLATRLSADWVKYGAIATGIAAGSSLLTLFYAASALNTWKKQEKTKIRSEFKRSLLALDYAVHMMPDEWDFLMAQRVRMGDRAYMISGDNEAETALIELKKCWHNSISAWVMCEGQLKKTNLTKQWNELSDLYVDFLKGKVKKLTILEKLTEMHSVEFIFD